jgi:uncharacterized membrane protein (UPF0127 family)
MSNGQSRWGNKVVIASVALLIVVLIMQFISAYVMPQTAVIHIGSHRFKANIADTEKTREQGLSGTKSLAADHAMFFVFDSDNRWPIWMKDMNYSIDIVWLDESKKVVDFAVEVSPDTYPTKSFFPKVDARYVVELKSGTVEKKAIRIGDQVVVSGTSKQL